MYIERTYQLEPILGKNYKYESIKIGNEAPTLEEAYNQTEEHFKLFIKLEKQNHPVKTGTEPF